MKTVTDGTACRIVAHENKQTYLPNCKSSELSIKFRWNFFCIYREVSLKDQIYDGFTSLVFGGVFVVSLTLITESPDVFIHLATV
jgi:hypothetical protein